MSVSKVCIRFWVFACEKLAFFNQGLHLGLRIQKVSVLSMHFHHLRVNGRPKWWPNFHFVLKTESCECHLSLCSSALVPRKCSYLQVAQALEIATTHLWLWSINTTFYLWRLHGGYSPVWWFLFYTTCMWFGFTWLFSNLKHTLSLPCPHNFFTSSFLHFLSNFFAFNIEGIEGTSSVTSPNTGSIFHSMVLQHWQDVKIRLWGFTKKAFTSPTQCNGVHEKRVDDSPCPWETRRIKSRTRSTHVYWIM